MDFQNEPVKEIMIRGMKRSDMIDIMTISADSFHTPWTEKMFARELDLSFSQSLVARVKELQTFHVAGFITFWIIADEVQLHKIAVRRDFRRRGVASQLFLAMLREALDQGAERGILEVRNSNEAARKLYEKFGFRVTAVRPSYYSETQEDGLIMSVELKYCPEVLLHA